MISKIKKTNKLNKLFKLLKKIKNNSFNELLNKHNDNYSKKGYLYEKLWDIIIKCGYHFSNLDYIHMDGNINTCKMNEINNLEYYLKNTKIYRYH